MIPAVKLENDCAFIPLIGGRENETVCVKWNDNEDSVTPFEDGGSWCTLRSNICFDEAYRHYEEPSSITQILTVYEIKDANTEVEYFLIAFDRIQNDDDILHCVAIPHNRLNLIKFYKEYIMTFPDVWVDN